MRPGICHGPFLLPCQLTAVAGGCVASVTTSRRQLPPGMSPVAAQFSSWPGRANCTATHGAWMAVPRCGACCGCRSTGGSVPNWRWAPRRSRWAHSYGAERRQCSAAPGWLLRGGVLPAAEVFTGQADPWRLRMYQVAPGAGNGNLAVADPQRPLFTAGIVDVMAYTAGAPDRTWFGGMLAGGTVLLLSMRMPVRTPICRRPLLRRMRVTLRLLAGHEMFAAVAASAALRARSPPPADRMHRQVLVSGGDRTRPGGGVPGEPCGTQRPACRPCVAARRTDAPDYVARPGRQRTEYAG